MTEPDPKIAELEARLDRLVRTQIDFQTEISTIRRELSMLRGVGRPEPPRPGVLGPRSPELPERWSINPPQPVPPPAPTPTQPKSPPPQATPSYQPPRDRPPAGRDAARETRPPNFGTAAEQPHTPDRVLSESAFSKYFSSYTESARADLEKFIGENLISKVGIVVLVLGVGIGAKYAIDNGWISPLMRVVFGYVMGFGLLAFATRLKAKYLNFSAVLLSGGMAILYFVTYFAYSAYGLINQPSAFGAMAVLTVFTVACALLYDRQVIAHIGLVGAYAVPFLLSTNSANYLVLFIYMTIINAGILAISLRKLWKPLFYTSSVFTWAIFLGWFAGKYVAAEHFSLALVFLGIFFTTFYTTKIVHGVIHGRGSDREDVIGIIVTAAIFYGFCFGISDVAAGLGAYSIFFSYLAFFSLAILLSSYMFYARKLCKPMFYTASFFTWLIFLGWFANRYVASEHFPLALIFLGIFFTTFYATRIFDGVTGSDVSDLENVIGIMVTAAIFYGFCFAISAVQFGAGTYAIFFSYLAFFSLAILLTSYRFYGRTLVYLSYPFTLLIFGVWFYSNYRSDEHVILAVVFASVFFAIYYGATLIYRLATDDIGIAESTGLVLSNSFVFYGFGYAILDSRDGLRGFEGLFTVAHAGFHSVVAHTVSRFKPSAVDIVQILAVLIITFSTIAIPVQFDGNLVTLIWSVEAATLFWFGRSRAVTLFEYLSYPLMALATGSLLLDWIELYRDWSTHLETFVRQPIANGDFVGGIVFVAAFAFIFVVTRDETAEPAIPVEYVRPFGIAVAAICILALYNTLRIEIGNYHQLQAVTLYAAGFNAASRPLIDLIMINALWQLNYTMFFLSVMGAVNLRKARSTTVALTGVTVSVATMVIFAIGAMQLFHHLRISYMLTLEEGHAASILNICIRYVSYVFAGALIYTLFKYSRDELVTVSAPAGGLRLGFDALFYSMVLITASCELLNLMGQYHIADGTKLGLSILWGVYALILIVIGIARDKKHLRIAAIVLLTVTLVKLFLYDVADLPTIPKTILFVSLGLLMLIVSFLYNKYKDKIVRSDNSAAG